MRRPDAAAPSLHAGAALRCRHVGSTASAGARTPADLPLHRCRPDRFPASGRLETRRLRAVLDEHVASRTPLYVLWPSGRHPTPKLRAFVDYLAAHLRV